LLLHILAEVQSLGFRVGVLVAGLYPLVDHPTAALLQFNRSEISKTGGLARLGVPGLPLATATRTRAITPRILSSSHVLARHPQCVDLGLLPPKGEKLVGVGGLPPQDATAAFGQETLNASAEVVIREVQHRPAHPELYRGHGEGLKQGLWRNGP